MVDRNDIEKTHTGSEARQAIVTRPRGASATAIGDALRRYLMVEHYRRRSKTGDAERTSRDQDPEA